MKEYIVSVNDDDMDYEEVFISYIKRQEELIRCKDCKYFRTYYHGEHMPFSYACDRLYLTNGLSNNDFCSRAERKEE